MIQKDRLKTLSPTLREKERYIAFKVISESPITYSDLESSIWQTMLDFYGEVGLSQTSLWLVRNLYDERAQTGVIKCNNKSVSKVIAGLGLITRLGETRIISKIIKISGTIKGLRLVI